MDDLKKSNRLAFKSQKMAERKELDVDAKKFLICVGRKDKKAFYIDINDKKAFPQSDEHLLSSLVERCKLEPGTKFHLYWSADLKSKAVLVQAIFFQYADNRANAQKLVDRLSTKLDKYDTRSDSLSIDTSKIVAACKEESLASEDDSDESLQFDEAAELNDATTAKSVSERRKNDSNRLRALAQGSQSNSDRPVTEERLWAILTDFKMDFKEELLHDLALLIQSGKAPEEHIGDITKEIEEKCNKVVQNGVQQLSKKLTDLLDPSKVALNQIKRKSYLFDENTDLCPWTTKNMCIKDVINDIYLRCGDEPGELFKSIARRMYGDLLCYYKCDVQRIYNDQHRKTRPPLQEFDPNGFKILSACIDQYTKIHAGDIVVKKTGIQLSSEQFRSLMFASIDKWGCKAYCKNGRSKPNIECLLLAQLRNGYSIKFDDTDEDNSEVLSKYESLKHRPLHSAPAAKKQRKTAVALRDSSTVSGATSDHSVENY